MIYLFVYKLIPANVLPLSIIIIRRHPIGMDPADPYFENTEPLIRLDPTDGNVRHLVH